MKLHATIILAMTLAAALASAAQNLPEGTERVLADHAFMHSSYMDGPFVGTTIGNSVGGGAAINLPTTFYDLDGNVLYEYEGTVFFGALAFDFQQNLWDTWAASVRLDLLARAGSNLESVLTEGANVDREIRLRLKKRILRNDRAQAALALDWSYSNTTLLTPRAFAEHIVDGGSLETAPLLVADKVWKGSLSANTAYALSRWWGLRVNGAAGLYEVPDASSVTKGLYRLSVMADLDLDQVQPIPIGVTLGYVWGAPTDNPHTGLSGAMLGVWYIGQPDFAIGGEMGFWQRPTLDREDKVDGLTALISLRYWF